MDEKFSETLLSSIKGHTVTIPNDIQQLTIKDSTVFIGEGRSYRSMSPCFRRLNILTLILAATMIVIVLLPTLYQHTKLVSISGTANSGYHLSFNRNILNPLIAAMDNAESMAASSLNAFGQNELSSTSSKSDVTILYSFRDPSWSLSEFFKFTSVYIARANQTTLSFFIQNNPGNTYLDDVSVNNSYGYQLIVNGGFENGAYGWQGVYSLASRCYSWSYSYTYSYCATSSYALNSTVSQTFNTTPGTELYISFKLRWEGSGSGILTKVTIYP